MKETIKIAFRISCSELGQRTLLLKRDIMRLTILKGLVAAIEVISKNKTLSLELAI